MWPAERAPGQGSDGLRRILLTDRKANNYTRADRLLITVDWLDGLPVTVNQQPYALALADQIEQLMLTDQLTVMDIRAPQ
jgi:hypothetical protein